MLTKRLPVMLLFVAILAAAAAGYYFVVAPDTSAASELSASGTIEATHVLIAPELAGKVAEVLVKEGDPVTAGQVLFTLDDALLQAQRRAAAAGLATAQAASQTAEAAVNTAEAQYELVLAGALTEQTTLRSADWSASAPADFLQPGWYFSRSEQASAAEADVADAQVALDAAIDTLATVARNSASGGFVAAEERLLRSRLAFATAQTVLAHSPAADTALADSAQRSYDEALVELTSAQNAYDQTLTTTGAQDVLNARADVRVAQERLDAAQDMLRSLQTGERSPKVTAAWQALEQARAAAAQAETAVAQAQANLALLDTQIGKLTVTAPADGIVLTRAIEPGEMVNPNASLLTLARLNDLTITVYVPEDQYGALTLGQAALVSADSFPGQAFHGVVTAIATQAEFTPRNVQTTAGRQTTVFAITLSLADGVGKLKPGMPADVVFK